MSLDNSAVVPALPTGGYQIEQSLRFNDDDSAYLSRTPSSASNQRTWTYSVWIKRSTLGRDFFAIHSNETKLEFAGTDNSQLSINMRNDGGTNYFISSNGLFRDTGAWYHIVWAVDTTQATASNRVKLYVNGEQITDLADSSYPPQNHDTGVNRAGVHYIGRTKDSDGFYFDGYMAEIHHIDGQQLDPTYFGETDEDYGHWKPIAYTGSYGTNGFYLDFDGTYYNDKSGNGNDWTATNLATTDIVLDSPTNNFCTLNPLDPRSWADEVTPTLEEGNLQIYGSGVYGASAQGTMVMTSGKWYAEFVADNNRFHCGINDVNSSHSYNLCTYKVAYGSLDYHDPDNDGWNSSNLTTWTTGSSGTIIGLAFDADNNNLYIYENGSLKASYTSVNAAEGYTWCAGTANTSYGTANYCNFGQDSTFAGYKTAASNTDENGYGEFQYTPPTGYLALCTANLSDPDVIPSEYFNSVLWSGNGGTQNVTGVGFQPDFVWNKVRNVARHHWLFNSSTGINRWLQTSNTDGEAYISGKGINSFNSDGVTWVYESNNGFNTSGDNSVMWNWKCNGGTTSSNTNGSITSTVQVNQDAGFSIVEYTGTGSNATVGHGLSTAPQCIIIKNNTNDRWVIWHVGLNGQSGDHWMEFDGTSTYTGFSNRIFSVGANTFGVDNQNETNGTQSAGLIAYCFNNVEGFSKFGHYTGNSSSDGSFAYTGFRPAYVLVKSKGSSNPWTVYDNKRDPYNIAEYYLHPDETSSEGIYSGVKMDFLSNGFKLRGNSGHVNGGNEYIYMAFAETPFKYTNAR